MTKVFNICLLFLLIVAKSYAQTIETFAGNGFDGNGTNGGLLGYTGDGGNAKNAQIGPLWIAADSKGNIYFSQLGYVIRKIDIKTGIISRFAGNDTRGYSGDGGLAINAQLNEPRGIVFDSKDNLYIADYWNNCIRRVDAITSVITTVAGNGTVLNGYTGSGGPAKDALLFEPQAVAVDANDNLYFTEFNNNCIRRIDAISGIISKVAGSDPPGYPGFTGDGGRATDAKLFAPWPIVVSKAGDIIFGDFVNNRVRKIDHVTGYINTIAGNGEEGFAGDGGPAVNAQVYAPVGLGIDGADNVYISSGVNDRLSYRIRKINAITNIITTVVGTGVKGFSGDGGPPENAQINPRGVVFDGKGNMFIADTWNYRIREISYPELAAPGISATGDCSQKAISFTATNTDNVDAIKWDFGDAGSGANNASVSQAPNHIYTAAGTYTVTVTVFQGSQFKTATQQVSITDCTTPGDPDPNNPDTNNPGAIFIPNTFTPNNDGINDIFRIVLADPPAAFTQTIYDRYGRIMFQSKSITKNWDGKYNGKDCPAAVYFYKVSYKQSGAAVVHAGSVTLLR